MVEFFIEQYVHDSFIRPYLGDFLVVILLYAILISISKLQVYTAAVVTLIFSYLVETAQYLQLVSFLGLEEYKWSRIIIGTSFSWWDVLMYSLGFLFIILIEQTSYRQIKP
ncbi:MAG: DUF2809 domain-containing protein [Nonlabens sp.]|uniref:ribosomal maturation YjgA family protein n=1 Tax=Nonlabens sp. TaxID=1888209 RepID=UPI00321A94E7